MLKMKNLNNNKNNNNFLIFSTILFLLLFINFFFICYDHLTPLHAQEYTIRAPQGVIPERCSEDNLSPEEAIERLYWANSCGYLSMRYLDFCLNDDNGSRRARPIYPSFVSSDFSKSWASCPKNRNADCSIPDLFTKVQPIFCISSCYTPDQKILFPQGEIPIMEAYQNNISTIMSIDQLSTIDNIILKEIPIKHYIKEAIDTNNKIITLTTESAKYIKVTENHPLIDGDGYIKEAKDFKIFDYLLNKNGEKEKIIDIKNYIHHGKVYNILPASNDLLNNILVAGGLLSGSAYYQNDGIIYLNRKILRDGKLPEINNLQKTNFKLSYMNFIFCKGKNHEQQNEKEINFTSLNNYLHLTKLLNKILLSKNEYKILQNISNDKEIVSSIFELLHITSNSNNLNYQCEKMRMGLIDSIYLLSNNKITTKETKHLITTSIKAFLNTHDNDLDKNEAFELKQILNQKGFMGVITN